MVLSSATLEGERLQLREDNVKTLTDAYFSQSMHATMQTD